MINFSDHWYGRFPEGVIERYRNFGSRFVDSRNVDIFLPPGYRKNKNYPVIYMHDGQNLFDPSSSFAGVDWGVDEAMEKLLPENKIRPAIITAIWNTPRRMTEYMPAEAFYLLNRDDRSALSRAYKEQFQVDLEPVLSDNYLRFIVAELKPFIDSAYSTSGSREDTFIMGSSMGGLISAYALAKYPEVFGGAGCISTHWPAGNGIVISYLAKKLPGPGKHLLYFDYGTRTADWEYEPYQKKMDEVMRQKGYTWGRNWITRKFSGAEHSEAAWRDRIHFPLEFFLGR
jgi:predicted alpha/beta superfamily hydrolase